jgi:hopene-associated glycosyltransferase HpnB
MVLAVLAGVSLLAWLYLVLANGGYWLMRPRLPQPTEPAGWPSVVAVVPARDEAAILPSTLPALLRQDYPGEFRVLLVDDASTDGTGDVAKALAEAAGVDLTVVPGDGPPPGWTGKVAALARGVAAAGEPDFLLFTDADIRHPAHSVRQLVCATAERDLVSLMARLRTDSAWERAIVPAFVYFFAMLYPFARVNRPGRTAAAAGGCVLVRRVTLESAGGLAGIKNALIDDVALGTLVKRAGGRIWLGLSTEVESLRPYPRLADLWDMIARSAYTQLGYSPFVLLGTVAGLLLLYAVPPVLAIVGAGTLAGWFALAAWLLIAGSYVPMLRAYRLPYWWAPLLPGIAVLYAAMTVDSAWRHVRGRGGAWKGRAV